MPLLATGLNSLVQVDTKFWLNLQIN